jgi:predicted phosphodiesterase
MVHATPSDPLYDDRLRPEASPALFAEACADVQAEVLLLGHTPQGPVTVVNPGSVGQPLDGDPRSDLPLGKTEKYSSCGYLMTKPRC